jgi:uncharacterized protein YdhG (YjbR/CyaY superfamily)
MNTDNGQFTTIDGYIASFSADVQVKLQLIRQTIQEVATGATEAIKYQMPTFVLYGNLVYFAAWKKHISLYPITSAMEEALPELAQYKTSGKGTVQFPLQQPLPLALIREIVAFRVRENLANRAQTQ